MLKSCQYCGRIHDSRYDCGRRPMRKRAAATETDRFRRSQAWTDKSIEIRQRDNYLCQICMRKLYNTLWQYNYNGLSVHHAVPVTADWEKRLDDDNLLTVCQMHHEMAENGEIPYEVVKGIIDEQEAKREATEASPGVID